MSRLKRKTPAKFTGRALKVKRTAYRKNFLKIAEAVISAPLPQIAYTVSVTRTGSSTERVSVAVNKFFDPITETFHDELPVGAGTKNTSKTSHLDDLLPAVDIDATCALLQKSLQTDRSFIDKAGGIIESVGAQLLKMESLQTLVDVLVDTKGRLKIEAADSTNPLSADDRKKPKDDDSGSSEFLSNLPFQAVKLMVESASDASMLGDGSEDMLEKLQYYTSPKDNENEDILALSSLADAIAQTLSVSKPHLRTVLLPSDTDLINYTSFIPSADLISSKVDKSVGNQEDASPPPTIVRYGEGSEFSFVREDQTLNVAQSIFFCGSPSKDTDCHVHHYL